MNILLSYLWSPYTTAAYYARAFRELGHDVRTVGPVNHTAVRRVPEHQHYRLMGPHIETGEYWQPDLFVYIEAGAGWWPESLPTGIPTVGYFIDTHSRLEEHMARAPAFDHVFVAHKQYVDRIPHAHWLPMGCDPDVHTPTRTDPPEYDVAFVGNTYGDAPVYAERRRVLGELAKRYKCNFQSGVYFEDMANVYASARVAFNISATGDLNMRVFEAMCSGRPLVTDDMPGLEELFRLPANYVQRCVVYRDMQDLSAKIHSALEADSDWLARSIGKAGRAEVLAHHTYKHRATQMLEAVGL